MTSILVISSYVAASRVGGGIAPYVLAPLGIEPILVPTTLLGRHPGWGAPGGGPVTVDQMSGMLDGIEANGCFASVSAVFTGYFAGVDQVAMAAEVIDRVRAAPRQGPAPLIMVDPIMGDADVGRYVPEAVAAALIRSLVPRADLVACNLWEFRQLTEAAEAHTAKEVAETAHATGRDWLVTSMTADTGVGALLADSEGTRLAIARRVPGRVPRGPGDLLKMRFLGGVLSGETRTAALLRSVGLTSAVLDRAIRSQAPEMPLAACSDLVCEPPEGWLEAT